MHILIERDTLVKTLGAAVRVVERRNTIPILGNVLVTAEGAGIAFTGTDLDMAVTIDAPAELSGKAEAFAAPAAMLHDIARKLPAGAQVALEHEPERGKLAVRAGRSRFTLSTLPATDFPDLKGGDEAMAFTVPGKALASLLSRCAFAISTEETRYYLNGIYLHGFDFEGEDVLRAVATDGHRLARMQMPAPDGMPEALPGIIVPRKAVPEIVAIAERSEEVTLAWDANKLTLTAPGVRLVTKLIDGTFPDYQRVIPTANDKHMIVDAGLLASAADRVSTISSERGRAVKLSIDAGKVRLAVSNPDAGEATDEIDVEYDAPAIEVGFNARYLADICGQADADTLVFEMADPGSPCVIRPNAGTHGAALYVLMPMRV